MENRQLNHQEISNKAISHSITVIAENLHSPENIGMVFRISEAMGVGAVIFCGKEQTLSPKAKKISRSTHKYIRFDFREDSITALEELKEEGFHLVALEITNKSEEIRLYNFESHHKIAIIIGSEKHGISHQALQIINNSVHINMFGRNSSINVINALTIALYEINRQKIK